MLKRLMGHAAVQSAAASLLGRYLRFALASTRWTVLGEAHFAPHAAGQPCVAAFWHECLPLMPALWIQARRVTPDLRLQVLVSRHKDGRFIGDVIATFGLEVAHGSSARDGRSRGGAIGALALISALEAGQHVAITPDGPRGPARVAAAGVAQLAGVSGCPVLPCAARMTRRIRISSWDRMLVPLPWGRGVIVCAAPVPVPREGWEGFLPDIARGLDEATASAEAWVP